MRLGRLRPLGAVLALSIAILGVIAPPGSAQEYTEGEEQLLEEADDEGSLQILVSLRSMPAQDAVVEDLANDDAEVVIEYDLLPYLLLEADDDTIEELLADPRVEGLQENTPDPPTLDSAIPVINADDTRDLGWDGSNRTVAILDTGIDIDHPFFDGRIVSQACYSQANGAGSGTTLCPNGMNSDTGTNSADAETANCLNGSNNICDHGSHVAGIAAGNGFGDTGAPDQGVASDANIIAIQVFTRFDNSTDCGSNPVPCVLTYDSDQVLGLQRVLALDDTVGVGDVVSANMSLGSGMNTTACDSDTRKAAVDALRADNIATVIAAGNSGFTNAVGAPGCISTAITVGSTEDDDDVSTFSNRGSLLDLFAPGTAIDSAVPDDGYDNKQGTSMAAPMVAGAWAALREAYPSASVNDIEGWLEDTGVDISYNSGANSTPRINLLAALQADNDPPTLNSDNASVSTNEGSTATNTGTYNDPEGDDVFFFANVGNVTFNPSAKTWSWSWGTNDGPTQSQTVTVTGRDDKLEEGTTSFQLTVNNVDPTLDFDASQDDDINEGDTLSALAHFSDPGWADTYTGSLDWGTLMGMVMTPAAVAVTTQGPPQDLGDLTGSFNYGDNGLFTVAGDVTDDDGGDGDDSFALTVHNVAPSVQTGSDQTINEGDLASVSSTFSDPGWLDTYTGMVDWGTPAFGPDSATMTDSDQRPNPDTGTASASRQYGDDGAFTVTTTVTDDDGDAGSDSLTMTVLNVKPDATIDTTGTTNINGTPTFLNNAGNPTTFKGNITDPGSDDETAKWDWGDGAPSPDESTFYPENPPGPDPDPSPNVNARNVNDTKAKAFGNACLYTITFTGDDDDGGSDSDQAKVVITGNAKKDLSNGQWQTELKRVGKLTFTNAQLNCYLAITGFASKVFNEVRDASTIAAAHDVMWMKGNGGVAKEQFDRELLNAYLNFANGSTKWNEMVAGVPFSTALANAEAVRLNPASTEKQIKDQNNKLKAYNK